MQVHTSETPDLGECTEKGKGSPILYSSHKRAKWVAALPAPRFAAFNGDMCAELLPGVRTLLTGTPIPSSKVGHRPPGVGLYAEGKYPKVVRKEDHSDVSWAAQWFGEGAYNAADAAQVWATVERELQLTFRDDTIRLYGTPATVGRDLWARTIPRNESWRVMSPDVQDTIRATAGQGRMEVFRPRVEWSQTGTYHVTDVYEYDARLAYVALMRNLPIGEPEYLLGHSDCAAWQQAHPYGEARWRVTWSAPKDWQHPGILPMHSPGGGVDWEWPRRCDIPSWCGGAELWTALQCGWHVVFHEGYVWPVSGDPLRKWSGLLFSALGNLACELTTDLHRRMARNVVRGILLHTVGALHGAPRKVSHTGDFPPENAQGIRAIKGQLMYAWYTTTPVAWPEMVHPEWSATIWGRARARLAYSHRGHAGFVTVPASQLLGVRTDAIFTTWPTGWEHDDNGDPGRWTLKGSWQGDWAWPLSSAELLRMVGR